MNLALTIHSEYRYTYLILRPQRPSQVSPRCPAVSQVKRQAIPLPLLPLQCRVASPHLSHLGNRRVNPPLSHHRSHLRNLAKRHQYQVRPLTLAPARHRYHQLHHRSDHHPNNRSGQHVHRYVAPDRTLFYRCWTGIHLISPTSSSRFL